MYMFISEGGKKIQSKINGVNNIKVTQKNKKKVSEQKSWDKFSKGFAESYSNKSYSNNSDKVELSPWAKFCKDFAESTNATNNNTKSYNKSYKGKSNYSDKVELNPWDKFLKFFKSLFESSNNNNGDHERKINKFAHGGGGRGRIGGSGGIWG